MRRLRHAVLRDAKRDDLLGETDGECISIFAIPMSHAMLVGTLIHEALHDWCKVRGRPMSCANEHCCIAEIGDPNEL